MFKDAAGHEDLTEAIIACGIRVHEVWGPGLLESVYKGHDLQCEFCPDLIVNGIVVIELKAIEKLAPVHKAQLITYLKLTGLPVGLLMNFNVALLKYGTHRVVRPDLLTRTE